MASAVDSRLAYARLSAVATASRLPTATRGSNNSYTTSWDTTQLPCTGPPKGRTAPTPAPASNPAVSTSPSPAPALAGTPHHFLRLASAVPSSAIQSSIASDEVQIGFPTRRCPTPHAEWSMRCRPPFAPSHNRSTRNLVDTAKCHATISPMAECTAERLRGFRYSSQGREHLKRVQYQSGSGLMPDEIADWKQIAAAPARRVTSNRPSP